MVDQDAKDINQMMPQASDVVVAAPKKSKFLWIVLLCIVVGIGLGVFVYQQSLKPTVPTRTPAPIATPTPSPLASPVVPEVSLVQPLPKTVSFPKAGEIRIYYESEGWLPLGIILTDSAGVHNFTVAAGNPNTQMRIFDTGYKLTGPTTVSIDTFLGTNSSQLSIGWAAPVANKCGFNGFVAVDNTPNITFATAQAKGEPLVSIQCWGDYSPSTKDPSSLDFNDYTMIWSYKPAAVAASGSPAASPSPSASVAGSPSPSPSRSPSPSPSPSVGASASPSVAASPTPTPSPRVSMPDTSEGTPVTGIFEVTVGTISIGLLLLIIGLIGLLAL